MKKLALFLSFLFVLSCTKDPIIYTLTTSANPADGGTVSPSTQQYDEGKTATITATASSEYVFQSWSGATGSTNSTSVVMNSDKSVTANFVKKKYALTTAVEGEGTVTEKVIKAGAATDYNSGTIVELTAVPSEEWMFVEWTGDITGTENPTQITIDKAKNVTAVFVKKQYPLTIEIEGEGTVTEKVIKQGLATDYNSGTIVELTAEPTGDWEFVEWTGDVISTENPVQITIDNAKTVKAKFMRYFDYKTPSYVWKNNIQPRFNLRDIEKENGLPEYISNTGSAYADFNGDGYFDIMSQGMAPDGTNVGYDFFINNGDDTFDIDNSFFNSDFQSDKARKTIVGDFNGDNKPDVVRISGQHDYLDKSNITLSNSDGSYVISKIEVVPVSQYHGFASGDIDNDGDLDLFFGSPGEDQGFAINNGDGTFVWKKSSENILNQIDGDVREQVQTVEIFDFNNDNNLDLIIGGSFNIRQGQPYLDGPTILWGDGSGFFDFNNKSEVFNFNQIPTTNTGDTCNLDDFVFGDINGDGLNEIILMFYICMDEGWGSLLEIYSPNSNFEFKRVTDTMLPDNIVRGVWLQLRDIDKNNKLDIVETELPSWRYEWNGSKFDKIN